MTKIKTFLIAFLLVLVVLVLSWYSLFGKNRLIPPQATDLSETQEVETPTIQKKVFLTVVFTPNNELNYEKDLNNTSSITAFGLLKEALDVKQIAYESKAYDFGVFVNSINNQISGSDKAWIYFVNGQSGQVAADKYILKPGDVIEWKYIEPN
jgi:hypothetical protein